MIAAVSPVIKRIRATDIFHVGVQRIGSIESALLSGVQSVGLAVAGSLAAAIAQTDDGVRYRPRWRLGGSFRAQKR